MKKLNASEMRTVDGGRLEMCLTCGVVYHDWTGLPAIHAIRKKHWHWAWV